MVRAIEQSKQDLRLIRPARGPVRGIVTAPGSKSITNRALLVAALAEGESTLDGALFSDDTSYMSAALRLAGVEVDADEARAKFRVVGRGGGPGPVRESIFLGNSGTSMRFLASYFALGEGEYLLDGATRMRERPIQELVDAIGELGGRAESVDGNGCPPLRIRASGLAGGCVTVPGHRSSQFFSSLLLSAPYMKRGLELHVSRILTHRPYLDLTADVMEAFGVPVEQEQYRVFRVSPGRYRGRSYQIEPDASAASYFLTAAGITGGQVTIRGLSSRSRQGDIELASILQRMGCMVEDRPDGLRLTGPEQLQGIDVDMNGCSDVALTLAAAAPFCTGPVRVRNVAQMRLQETDRIHAVVTEMRRAGLKAEERKDGFTIFPGHPRPSTFDTYEDHRMAMSLALIGLRVPGCAVRDPGCVKKTFPAFFEVLESVTG